ncbi:MAG TPA: glycosyltransferase family 39 protein [Chitinophagaceae bacterium]|nr:glycosyltransferase family 39 protein [Chitinophagaceae bacterium]
MKPTSAPPLSRIPWLSSGPAIPSRTATHLLLFAAVAMTFTGMFDTILGPDGALYAQLSKEMVLRGDYVRLIFQGKDWLDKPHFPFWMAALSFRIFGFTTWAYKLPAILFLLMGARYTYLLGSRLYDRRIGLWSAIILLTSEHIILSNNDVRAEPYLTGLVVAAVYHLYRSLEARFRGHVVAASAFTAAAIMTKGLFVLVPIGGAIAGGLVLGGRARELFRGRWVLFLLLTCLFITPELYCLWAQFDSHPEKLVFGQTHVSGIRFFFWDSQFGRFLNTGPIRGKGSPLFFFHTLLWAFAPWSLLCYAAVVRVLQRVRRAGSRAVPEWFTWSGAALGFIMFSLSRFQLPHYTNILFPFFAILTAHYLFTTYSRPTIRRMARVQRITGLLLLLLAASLAILFRGSGWVWWALLLGILGAGLIGHGTQRTQAASPETIGRQSGWVVLAVNLYLILGFYPTLLTYQAGSEAAKWLNRHEPGREVAAFTDPIQPDLAFYLHAPVRDLDTLSLRRGAWGGASIVYLPEHMRSQLRDTGTVLATFGNYPVSRLSLPFLQPARRNQQVEPYVLVKTN